MIIRYTVNPHSRGPDRGEYDPEGTQQPASYRSISRLRGLAAKQVHKVNFCYDRLYAPCLNQSTMAHP